MSRRTAVDRTERVTATPERIRHGDIQEIEVMPEGTFTWRGQPNQKADIAAIDRRCSLLHRYWQDQALAPEGDYDLARARFEAGDQLATLYDQTGYRRGVTGGYGQRTPNGEMDDEQDEFITAKRRTYNGIVAQLQQVSRGAASAVVNLCCHDFDPVDRRDLIRGLDWLVRHWGI